MGDSNPNNTSGNGVEKFKSVSGFVGALVVTIFTAAIVTWWLILVANRIGVKPVVENGSVTLDEWSRAKDILLVVLPLFTATLAYWVGSRGTADAKEEAAGAKAQLDAVIDSSPEGILKKAKKDHPDAFSS
jgi:hypothetical protein